MLAIVLTSISIVIFGGLVTAYVLRARELRFERMLVATFGALAFSLLGRVTVDPSWLGHLMFVTGGALAFSGVDWVLKSRRTHPRPPARD